MQFKLVLTAVLATMLLSCCSGGNSPIVPTDTTPETGNGVISDNVSSTDTNYNPYRGVFGAWHVVIDTEKLTAEIMPARNAKKIGNIFDSDLSQFLTVTPCADCLQIVGVTMALDGYFHLDIAMKHPFSNIATRPDLHGFDVRAIIIGDKECIEESEVTVMKPDGSEEPARLNNWYVLNADGYTSHYKELVGDKRYFIQGEPCNCNLNPYLRFFESYSMGSFNPNAPTGYNVMPVGSGNYTRTIVFFPYGTDSQIRFYIVADLAYGQSAVLANRKNPQYYLPAFNRTEPWRMEYWIENNNLSENTDSTADVVVQVFDWQHNATVDTSYPNPSNLSGIPQSSKVSEVKLVIPMVMSDPIVVTTPEAGTGTPDDPLRYRLKVKNEMSYYGGRVTGMIVIRDELYGQAAPSGRLPVPESPTGFPYSTPDIRDYAYYGEININFPNQADAGVYKNELWVNPRTLFANDSTRVEAQFYQDDSNMKFQYQWDYDYDGVTFDVDGSGLPSPRIIFAKPGKKNLGLRVRTNSVPPHEYIYNIPAYAGGKVFDGVPTFANTNDYFTSPQGNNAVAATKDAFYVVFTGKQSGFWNVFLAKIDKLTGDNWALNVTDGLSADRCYDPTLTVIEEGPNAGVYIVFTFENGGLTYIVSTHGNLDGSGFDLSNIVQVTSTYNMNAAKPCLFYNNDGSLVCFYQGVKLTNESHIYSVVSSDFAHQWISSTMIDPGSDKEYRPSAAYSSANSNFYVVWEDDRNSTSLRDLYLAINPGGDGISWVPLSRLATSPETSAIWDEKPCMTCCNEQLAIAYLQRPNGSDYNSIHVFIKSLEKMCEVHYQITDLYGNYDFTEPSISSAADGIFMVGFGAIWEGTVVKSVVTELEEVNGNFSTNVIKEESAGSPGDYSSLISPCVVCNRADDGYALETFVMSTDYTDGYVEENSRHLGKLNGFYYISRGDMY